MRGARRARAATLALTFAWSALAATPTWAGPTAPHASASAKKPAGPAPQKAPTAPKAGGAPAKQPAAPAPAHPADPTTKPGAAEATPKEASAAKKPAQSAPKKGAKSKTPSVAGKAPRKQGTPAGAPDPGARAAIAGEEPPPAKVEDSPELVSIKEVDDVLFPDVRANEVTSSSGGAPGLYTTGLPPSVTLDGYEKPAVEETTDFAWLGKLQKPDLPFRWDPRLVRYLDYFKNSPKGRAMVAALMKRSGRYIDSIQRALRANKMPEDLVWLALVESGMNPRIASHAGAAGLWQFMPKAATAYGLRIDRWVDERLDPERSTLAAVRYLGDLHTRFGRWELALAAYNMGHGGLLTAIRKYNTNDYWELSQFESGVPYETALYVPKIVALAFVGRNRAVFGCDGLELDAPESFDSVSVAPGVSVESVAGAAGASTESILALNPQLLGTTLPPRSGATPVSYEVRVPAGTGARAEEKLPKAAPSDLDRVTLRWGESLESVALAHGTTEAKLRQLNALSTPVPPRPGSEILVPHGAAVPKATKVADPLVAVVPAQSGSASGKRHVLYEVVWGDDLEDVARVLGVTVDELCHWNNVDPTARLHAKMVLQAFVSPDKDLSSVRLTDASDAHLLTVGSPEFFDYFEAKNGRTRITVTVKKGDTWASLAKRHGLSLGQLERINQRSHYAKLEEGEQIVVYTKRSDAVARPVTNDGGEDTLYDPTADTGDGAAHKPLSANDARP
jgi:membrane-bound lytic murein transglycosylase D